MEMSHSLNTFGVTFFPGKICPGGVLIICAAVMQNNAITFLLNISSSTYAVAILRNQVRENRRLDLL